MDIPRPEDVPGASQNQDQLQTQQHVRKRRRTQLACNSCRQRKTACNGDRPSCSSCIRRGVQDSCSYEEATVGSKASINTGWVFLKFPQLQAGYLLHGISPNTQGVTF